MTPERVKHLWNLINNREIPDDIAPLLMECLEDITRLHYTVEMLEFMVDSLATKQHPDGL